MKHFSESTGSDGYSSLVALPFLCLEQRVEVSRQPSAAGPVPGVSGGPRPPSDSKPFNVTFCSTPHTSCLTSSQKAHPPPVHPSTYLHTKTNPIAWFEEQVYWAASVLNHLGPRSFLSSGCVTKSTVSLLWSWHLDRSAPSPLQPRPHNCSSALLPPSPLSVPLMSSLLHFPACRQNIYIHGLANSEQRQTVLFHWKGKSQGNATKIWAFDTLWSVCLQTECPIFCK